MKALLARYERWLLAPSTGLRLGFFRIAFGLYLLVHLGSLAPHVEVLFSSQGVYLPYLLPDFAPAPAIAWLLYAAMMSTVVALTLGYRLAWSAPLLLVLYGHHYALQLAVKQSSFERLILIYLALFSVTGPTGVCELGPRSIRPATAGFAERMIAVQGVLLYTGAGLWKALNPAWHTGALLYSTLQGMWATPIAFRLVQAGFSEQTWTVASWAIIATELLLGPMLLVRRTRMLAVVLAAAFHLTNCVVLFIPEFLVSVTALVVFFDERTLARVARVLARTSTPAHHIVT